jgi:hypothetical protein
MKEAAAEHFRWAAHSGGLAVVKAKDYEGEADEIAAASPYAAWKMLAETQPAHHSERGMRPLRPGDVLEAVTQEGAGGDLQIFKYIGFEPAKWYVPEPAPDTGTNAAGSAIPQTPAHSI